MFNEDFNIIEYAIGSVYDRHIWEKPHIDENSKDCYESVFRHSDEIKKYASEHRDPKTKKQSVSGYEGVVWADKLILDIDREGDLESAKTELSKVLRRIELEYDIDLRWLRINFSGSKGFHVFIPAELFGGFEASEELPEQLKAIGKKLTEGIEFDFSFYHHTGLMRLENTRHSTSEKYAIPLTANELFTLSIDEIKELASSPREMDVFDVTQLNSIPKLVGLKDNIEYENDEEDEDEQADKTKPNYYQELWQGQPKGNRNIHLSKIIGHLIQNNLPNESIRVIVKYWNEHNKPPHSTEEIEKEIKHGIKNFKFSKGEFWRIKRSGNGVFKSEINFYDLIEFLEQKGYAKKYLDQSYLFIKNDSNVVDMIELEKIKDNLIAYIKHYYQKNAFNKRELLNELYSRSGYYFGRKLIECIPSINLEVIRDKQDEAYYYFNNGFVKVTKDEGIRLYDYSELEGRIWKSQIIQRDFNRVNDERKSVYEQFLFNVAGKSDDRLKTIKSSIGYLLHGYKDSANAKVVVLVDEKIPDDGEPNGRTGKSIYGKALSKLKKSSRIDGKNFTFTERFTFQEVYLDTKILEFNDVTRKFDFERLFSVTTDDMTIENKKEKPFTLKFEDSPKLLVSTNYTIKGQGASYEDRLFEVEFSDHYNENHKPLDDFGKRLFDDWDADEWNRFDNFMLECVELFLKEGLVEYKPINLERRKLLDQTSPEFIEFAEQEISAGDEYDKTALFNKFRTTYTDFTWLKQRTFTNWTKAYSGYMNYSYNTRESNGTSYFKLEDPKGGRVDNKSLSLFD
ncbi:MAG: hypothetical protein HND40_00195 [Ignavibacteriota bacterium]|nr:hypothetical protein [Ignavibacteriota bacterium]MCO6447991.1 primase C-terminal domain-containing protein [Ignavibacterium album]MCZ2268390.1 hypothetical protein [Ignavibacteriales bacterium]QKJ98083.1 MAG: hypothetical protein HND40_00195 [Ignavibacteriota bacterium]HOJ06770.1 hypothetical protein [Ignavibacteriaceae bacterium]